VLPVQTTPAAVAAAEGAGDGPDNINRTSRSQPRASSLHPLLSLQQLGRAAAAIRMLCLRFNYGDCPNLPATCALPSGTRLYHRCDALMANGTLCNHAGHPRIHHL
jgi:hypothetical protein